MLNLNIAQPYVILTTFSCIQLCTITDHKIFVTWIMFAIFQKRILAFIFARILTSEFAMMSQLFSFCTWCMQKLPATTWCMQKLPATSYKNDKKNCFCLPQVCLVFEKGKENIKQVNYIFFQTSYAVKLIETIFYKHCKEDFLLLFQTDDFLALQGVVLVPRRLVLLEESSRCPLRHRAE